MSLESKNLVSVFLLFVLLSILPARVVSAGEKIHKKKNGIRAVQISFIDVKSYGEIDREFRRLKASGIDTVIMRVFHNRGDRFYPFVEPGAEAGVYFKTERSPVVADILSEVTELAHRSGLRIFAWMTTRYADYGVEDREDLACMGYDIKERKVSRCKGLDMLNEKAVRHLEGLYRDLAAYDIDGVLFQDDLVLRHNEGFGEHAEAAFRRETGVDIAPENFYYKGAGTSSIDYTSRFWEWAAWKNRRLLKVAERLKRTVLEINPGVEFAINLMYESVVNPPFALAWLSQDLEQAAKTGFDYYSIMTYHRQMGDELGKGPEEIRELIARMVDEASSVIGEPHRVLIKIQTVDWTTGEPLEVSEIVNLIRDIKGKEVSLAVVPYRADFPFHELGRLKGYALFNSPH